MSSYDVFGKFYDAVMGDRAGAAERLSKYICNASPRAKSVLELGCGTGSVLKHLASSYDVSGVDLSNRMLSIAARKVPQAALFRQDMVRLRLNKRFDVICCVFDSINHLLRFSDWTTVFSNVKRHLSMTAASFLTSTPRENWIATSENLPGFTHSEKIS